MKSTVIGRAAVCALGHKRTTDLRFGGSENASSTWRINLDSLVRVQDCPYRAYTLFSHVPWSSHERFLPLSTQTNTLLNFFFLIFLSPCSLSLYLYVKLLLSLQEPQKHHLLPEAFLDFFTALVSVYMAHWSRLYSSSLCHWTLGAETTFCSFLKAPKDLLIIIPCTEVKVMMN